MSKMIGLPLFTEYDSAPNNGTKKREQREVLHRVKRKRNAPEEKQVIFRNSFVSTQTNPALRRNGPVQVLKGNTRFNDQNTENAVVEVYV